jgi:hypothetical protein
MNKKAPIHILGKLTPGVDFTKLFRQAKSCRCTAFGKKNAVQFHQQSSKAKFRSKFAKICMPFAKRRSPKRRLILRANVGEIDHWYTYIIFDFCALEKVSLFADRSSICRKPVINKEVVSIVLTLQLIKILL